MTPEKLFHDLLGLGLSWEVVESRFDSQIGTVFLELRETPKLWEKVTCPHDGGVAFCYDHVKALAWRHPSTAALNHMLVLAPNPEWVATLPNGKLPDRSDFTRYSRDFATRSRLWHAAVDASQQLVDEFAQWLDKPDMAQVHAL